MIDKKSEEWKAQPRWLRFNLIGIRKRKGLVLIEIFCVVVAVINWLLGSFSETRFLHIVPLLFLCAYSCTWLIRKADKYKVW